MMHALFSAFDGAVLRRRLFKMDTVGDAYICAAFAPAETPESYDATVASIVGMCCDVLAVAGDMLSAVEEFRTGSGPAGGLQVGCRIGVSAGTVLCGALGRLQPRFHLFGPGLRAAELCEQSGQEGCVHAR